MEELDCPKLQYGIISNIPDNFHSTDLRNYFSQFIEAKGFNCFHFRHRPETKIPERRETDGVNRFEQREVGDNVPGSSGSTATVAPCDVYSVGVVTTSTLAGKEGSSAFSGNKRKTFCCIVRLTGENMKRLIKMYHRKPWIDKTGTLLSSRCFISRIKDKLRGDVSDEIQEYKTRGESKLIPEDREEFTESHLTKLAELNPPDLMPHGNVGTPTAVFLEYIRTCRLPPRIIKKLGLTFSTSRTNRRYGNVPFAYGGETVAGQSEEEVAVMASGQEIRGDLEGRSQKRKKGDLSEQREERNDLKNCAEDEKQYQDSDSDEADDDDTCEEWERHESLHEDITSQERTKERLFEEVIELKWEKGGSGLVFYTDAAFWDAQDGDFDEKTSDDWDVDMSIYYDQHGGDKDARDSIEMRRMERLKRGLEDASVFERPDGIGLFEKHTKGIGRKVLQQQGWAAGQGLGKTSGGMADALENSGQHSRDKTGFGYYGEKLLTATSGAVKKRRVADKEVIISTIYDDPSSTDPPEPLMRSRGPHHLKYRHEIEFVRGDQK